MSGEERPYDSGGEVSNDQSSAANELPPEEEATTTGTAVDDSNRPSQMAKGLSYTISSIIRDFDTQARHTSASQHHLSSAIDRLTNELDQLLADAPSPFIMQHAAKISGVRKRVSSLNSVLKSIQRRVDNIDRLVSAGLPIDEVASGSPAEY
ncbi:uncharacterized protein LOC143538223 [Bidens hawaiensis]|uniref:uncharacterized protein LOC143538223 n=1 Tax=Bidens hawaiensis TaxID=980011 RepID=UPI004049A2CA